MDRPTFKTEGFPPRVKLDPVREELAVVALTTSTAPAPSQTSPNGTIAVSRASCTSGAVIDILDVPLKSLTDESDAVERTKRDTRSKFRGETYVHSIPFIVCLCYLCLWIASTVAIEGTVSASS